MARDASGLSGGTDKSGGEGTATEDTGLIKVGDEVKTVKYVPSQETTVYKRTGSITEETFTNGRARRLSRDVVEEATRRRDKEILERMASHMSQDSDRPVDSTYRRIGSNYSLNSLSRLFNMGEEFGEEPTEKSRQIAVICISLILIFWTALCVLSVLGEDYVLHGVWWAILVLVLLALAVIAFVVALLRQPRNLTKAGFSVPFVPLLPLLSTMVNIYLMLTLSYSTWMRFLVWMGLGMYWYMEAENKWQTFETKISECILIHQFPQGPRAPGPDDIKSWLVEVVIALHRTSNTAIPQPMVRKIYYAIWCHKAPKIKHGHRFL